MGRKRKKCKAKFEQIKRTAKADPHKDLVNETVHVFVIEKGSRKGVAC